MMKSTSINMGGIFLEQSVKTQSKLTQMIKMLLVAYLVTGLLLLILAFLPDSSWNFSYIHFVLFCGKFCTWKKHQTALLFVGNGTGGFLRSAFNRSDMDNRAQDTR